MSRFQWSVRFVLFVLIFTHSALMQAAISNDLSTQLKQFEVVVVPKAVLQSKPTLQQELTVILAQLHDKQAIAQRLLRVHKPLFTDKKYDGYEGNVRAFSAFIGKTTLPFTLKNRIRLFNVAAVSAVNGMPLWKRLVIGGSTVAAVVGAALFGWYLWPKKNKKPGQPLVSGTTRPSVVADKTKAEKRVGFGSRRVREMNPDLPAADVANQNSVVTSLGSGSQGSQAGRAPVVTLDSKRLRRPGNSSGAAGAEKADESLAFTLGPVEHCGVVQGHGTLFLYSGQGEGQTEDRALVKKLKNFVSQQPEELTTYSLNSRDKKWSTTLPHFFAALLLWKSGDITAQELADYSAVVKNERGEQMFKISLANAGEHDNKHFVVSIQYQEDSRNLTHSCMLRYSGQGDMTTEQFDAIKKFYNQNIHQADALLSLILCLFRYPEDQIEQADRIKARTQNSMNVARGQRQSPFLLGLASKEKTLITKFLSSAWMKLPQVEAALSRPTASEQAKKKVAFAADAHEALVSQELRDGTRASPEEWQREKRRTRTKMTDGGARPQKRTPEAKREIRERAAAQAQALEPGVLKPLLTFLNQEVEESNEAGLKNDPRLAATHRLMPAHRFFAAAVLYQAGYISNAEFAKDHRLEVRNGDFVLVVEPMVDGDGICYRISHGNHVKVVHVIDRELRNRIDTYLENLPDHDCRQGYPLKPVLSDKAMYQMIFLALAGGDAQEKNLANGVLHDGGHFAATLKGKRPKDAPFETMAAIRQLLAKQPKQESTPLPVTPVRSSPASAGSVQPARSAQTPENEEEARVRTFVCQSGLDISRQGASSGTFFVHSAGSAIKAQDEALVEKLKKFAIQGKTMGIMYGWQSTLPKFFAAWLLYESGNFTAAEFAGVPAVVSKEEGDVRFKIEPLVSDGALRFKFTGKGLDGSLEKASLGQTSYESVKQCYNRQVREGDALFTLILQLLRMLPEDKQVASRARLAFFGDRYGWNYQEEAGLSASEAILVVGFLKKKFNLTDPDLFKPYQLRSLVVPFLPRP